MKIKWSRTRNLLLWIKTAEKREFSLLVERDSCAIFTAADESGCGVGRFGFFGKMSKKFSSGNCRWKFAKYCRGGRLHCGFSGITVALVAHMTKTESSKVHSLSLCSPMQSLIISIDKFSYFPFSSFLVTKARLTFLFAAGECEECCLENHLNCEKRKKKATTVERKKIQDT